MSTETSLNDVVPSVTSRLQNLRLAPHGEDGDVTENVATGSSNNDGGLISPQPQPIGNVTSSRARCALNFNHEEQSISSSVARNEASLSNSDK